jgi:hypothetical protein
MMFIKSILVLSLAALALAVPAIQPRQDVASGMSYSSPCPFVTINKPSLEVAIVRVIPPTRKSGSTQGTTNSFWF